MSLKTLHSIIIFAGVTISLISAWWCFTSPDAEGNIYYHIAGGVLVLAAIGLIGYEIHFLKKTRKLIL
jgi:hypothetical protein